MKGKKLVGWAFRPDAQKADLKCKAVVKDSWIIKYSPQMDLYGVWKPESTDDPDDPETVDPDPGSKDPDPDDSGPDSGEPEPDKPNPDSKDPDPVQPKDPGVDEKDLPRGKIISFHCRFISKKYFEDAGRNLIPKERGGLAGDSKWIMEDSLRVWLRQLLA